jgi:hypothetical protein
MLPPSTQSAKTHLQSEITACARDGLAESRATGLSELFDCRPVIATVREYPRFNMLLNPCERVPGNMAEFGKELAAPPMEELAASH